jgi:L-alanine-DL-glutamate epimerase-like enolase superfamily enzyme
MKITRLRTVVVDLPIKPPIVSAIFAIHSTSCILCFLETDEGLVGEGLVHAINGLRVKVLHEMAQSLEQLVLGLDPTLGGSFNARAWKELNFLGYEGVTIQAMAGIDLALWDLRGKAAGLNVSRLIGAVRQEVPAYASGGLWLSSSIDELQREAADFVAAGFRAVKTRVGQGQPEAMVARVRAVREAIGPDIGLMVDANQQLSVPEAIRLGRMLEPLNLTWFEEPVICYNHEGEAAVSEALDTPIASGETVHTHRGVLRMLQARAADILMPDVQRMGGPTEFLKAGALCEAFNTPISSHLFPEFSLPLLAALPNALYLEHMPWFEPLYGQKLVLDREGKAIVPVAPGWGVNFDPAAIAHHKAP